MDNEIVINNTLEENLYQVETKKNEIECNANNDELGVLVDESNEVEDIQEKTIVAKEELFNSDNGVENSDNVTPVNNSLSTEKTRAVGVYVKVNEEGFVTDVRSDLFIGDFDGWIKIDEGVDDRFVHAQASYFDKPLVDDLGNFQVKL